MSFMILQRMLKDVDGVKTFNRFVESLSEGERSIKLAGLAGSSQAMAIAFALRKLGRPGLVIAADIEEAEKLYDDLKAFLGEERVWYFPSWGIAPYEIRAPHTEIIGQRLITLYNISLRIEKGEAAPFAVIAPAKAVIEPTITRQALGKYSLRLEKGNRIEHERLIELLSKLNYRRTPVTEMLGEYSVRGGIIDLFTPYDEDPVRIEYFGDEIESIRNFSVLSQRSTRHINSTYIMPRRELVFESSLIDRYAESLDETQAQALHVALGDNGDYEGLEFIWPNLDLDMVPIFDHLPGNVLIFTQDENSCLAEVEDIIDVAGERHEMMNDTPVSEVEKIYLDSVKLERLISKYQLVDINNSIKNEESKTFEFRTRPQEFFSSNISYFKNRLKELHAEEFQINILCESAGQKSRIGELLEDFELPVNLDIARLSSGFALLDLNRWYLTDHQIFTRHKKRRTFMRFREGVALSAYTNLNPGDYVVHIDYGIGKFNGLEILVIDGRKRDCLSISYLGDDKLYVPVEEFNRVQKYAGKDGAPRLSKLGTATWERIKARTRRALMEMAGELIELYAERQAYPGFAFKQDSDWIRQLEASFEYEETPDQLKVMEEIKIDMEKPVPMDRLVCGDVGYGKTELAIRAALKAVDSGKQVAVLVPTTILAAQHYDTFTRRLADFPVNIEMLSRFRTSKQIKKIKECLIGGTVDIVIGTHMLLQKSVVFKDLGLLVVDEEQRFGVGQKEKIKKLRTQVDVLTLTATPIPRTLQLSLAQARDMSIINTPPKERLPIITEVSRFSDSVITDAVMRELDRGGQVYIVHNRVQSIWAFNRYLANLMPLVKIAVGHGQMSERDLEQVMKDFIDKKYQVLLATTIIESGLDIPSVNTIVINRADKLGLAQLYQLRGRVGRSRYRAFAKLLIPPLKLLTKEARKRLKAIEEFTELGSGFHLAMRDLEIRGAGNLLGSQQHGFIEEVGFDLYVKLLEEAVAMLKGISPEEHFREIKTTTDLDLFIPENYIGDSNQRVDIYRRFSGAETSEAVEDLIVELTDRYGEPPEAVKNLANFAVIKMFAKELRAEALTLKNKTLTLEFAASLKLGRDLIEKWVAAIENKVEFKYGRNFIVLISLQNDDDRASEVKNILQKMQD